MKISTGAASAADTHSAITNAISAMGDIAPDFVVAHLAAGHDADTARAAIRAAWGDDVVIHGGTSCLGVMTGAGACITDGQGLGLAALQDEDGDFGVGLADLGDDPRAAAAAAARKALQDAGRVGEAPDLIWLTAAPGAEEAVIAGIEDVVGKECQIVGGSAADNSIAGDWFVFDGASRSGQGIVISMLFPSGASATAYQSGYAPTNHFGVATRTEGRRVYEINDRPAREVYAEWTNGAVCADTPAEPAAILADSTFAPLGRKGGDVADVPFYLLAHPSTAHPDDSLELFADIDQGEELRLMSGGVESLTSRAGRVAAQALEQTEGQVAGALMVYCGGCMLAVQDHMERVAEGIDRALGGAPFLGVFTFGEQGPVLNCDNRHGNLMISCVTFAL